MNRVERAPYTDAGQMKASIDATTPKLKAIEEPKKEDLEQFIEKFEAFNATLQNTKGHFWDDKSCSLSEMEASMTQLLAAISLFKANLENRSSKRHVDQAVAALSGILTQEMNKFIQGIRNLKDIKIGKKVEQTHHAKETGA